MRISISSIIMSLLLALILICLLQLILKSKRFSKVIRTDFLIILSLLIFLRLLLPVEFPNTKTIPSTVVLPFLYRIGSKTFEMSSFLKINIFQILVLIWIIGTTFKLLYLSYNLVSTKRNLKRLSLSSTKEISLTNNGEAFTVYKFNLTHSPFVTGILKPRIFLPTYITDKDIESNILNHEALHIKNHDLLKKLLLELIECIYWWFPLIYTFKKQSNLIIEMSIDQQVTEHMNSKDYFQYVDSLVSVSKASNLQKKVSTFNKDRLISNFTISENNSLSNRIKLLLSEYEYKHTSKYILSLILFLPLLLTSTIFEPYSASPQKIESTKAINKDSNDYVLKKKNHYYLIIGGENMGKISNLNDESIKGLPIRNKEK